MEQIQKNISTFIESQFPDDFRENGPVFVEFVKQYYKWMETFQTVDNVQQLGTVSVRAQNTTVIGAGTFFDELSPNTQIAIYRTDDNYDLFTINTISSNTVMSVAETPVFTNTSTIFSNTQVMFNPTYYQRRLLEFNDVDDTTDQFLLYFKNTYLTDIQFDINSDIRLLLKHTLDLYRSKGTEQAVDLLFRIVFGTAVEIYYPSVDIFKLSDGVWKKPRYLEISLCKNADVFVGLQVEGVTSKATAFVEKLVRRKINGRLVDVLYVSNITGTFILGEKLQSPLSGLTIAECPIMIGSLTNIAVDQNGIGAGYNIGDIVDVYSNSGGEARARVTSTTSTSGIINSELIDGGYAYTANSIVYVSNNTMTINTIASSYSIYNNSYFDQFETLTQLYANVSYVTANGQFNEGSNVYSYFANGSQKGIGIVLFNGAVNNTAGSIVVSPVSGNIVSNAIFSVSNTVGAQVNVISGFVWANATAQVLTVRPNISIYANAVNAFILGDNIWQNNDIGIVTANGTITKLSTLGAITKINVLANAGKFQTAQTVYSNSGGLGVPYSLELNVDVVNVNSVFYANGLNTVTGSYSNGSVTTVSAGAGANISFSNTLLFQENVNINNTYISGYLTTPLANGTFQFPASPSGNLTSGTINSMMQYANVTIGRIASITTAQGSAYTSAPTVVIVEPWTYPYRYLDDSLQITGSTTGFIDNELVTQSATGARGLVKPGSNTTVLHLERLTWNAANNFVLTSNVTTEIVGVASGATANLVGMISVDPPPYLGINANVVTSLAISNSSISGLEVIESGYGFQDGEQVSIFSTNTILFAFANVVTAGTGRGFYLKDGGFLSSNKKIFDGVYYQNYSYDIRSSVTLDKYKQMLKQVIHTAGTMLFGTLVHRRTISKPSQYSAFSVTKT